MVLEDLAAKINEQFDTAVYNTCDTALDGMIIQSGRWGIEASGLLVERQVMIIADRINRHDPLAVVSCLQLPFDLVISTVMPVVGVGIAIGVKTGIIVLPPDSHNDIFRR